MMGRLRNKLHFGWSKGPKESKGTAIPAAAPDTAGASQTQPPVSNPSEATTDPDRPYGQAKESQDPPSASTSSSDVPIRELWNVAYEKLREEERELVQQYEDDALSGGVAAALGSMLGAKASRREKMDAILRRKMDEVNRDTWRLKFAGGEVPVRDLAEPVLGVVGWANDYIATAVSASPYASIAWSGVSLLLPVGSAC